MQSDKLIIRHKRKLSVYFALFVLVSLWFAQGIFLISEYVAENYRLVKKLETRIEGVRNILANKSDYERKMAQRDDTLRLVLEKSLEGVTIYRGENRVLGSLDKNTIGITSRILYGTNKIYIHSNYVIDSENYEVFIEANNEYSYIFILRDFAWFLLLTFPLSILFYFIGSFFVGKNLRPINEMIQSLEDFSSNLNHEIKTPLSELISTLSLAKRTHSNYEEAIDTSLISAQKITSIVDSMKALLRLVDVSFQKEKIDIVKTIENITGEFVISAKKKHIDMHIKFSQEPIWQKVNRAHVELLVGNLLKNAIKYSHENGEIFVKFENQKLVIQDFGVGISAENLSHIYDRYFRENYVHQEGYGLGLALVKKIADLYGWKIDIASQKEIGTTVTVYFLHA